MNPVGSEHGNRAPWLLAAYLPIWLALAIEPLHRRDWLLENLLVFAALPLLWFGYRRLRFSNFSYGCLFVFFLLHTLGAHYTYSEVPYADWFAAISGTPLNTVFDLERNHYDRLVHFSYGLLITPAAIELLDARAPSRGLWRWLLPWLFICAHSTLYEVIEWLVTEMVAPDLGQAFLGTQGDVWDAQKDAALAALGSAISLVGLRSLATVRAQR